MFGIKIPRITLILLILLIAVFIVHFNILKFQHHYQLRLGGTGDREYFSNDHFGPEFGVKSFLLWVRFQWIRPMGKGFTINLPQSFHGDNLILSFNIFSRGKRAILLAVKNYKNDSLGFLNIKPDDKFNKYQIAVEQKNFQDGLVNIKVINAENPEKITKLQIERLEVISDKGSSLLLKDNLLFIFTILIILGIVLIGGFSLNASVISSIAAGLFLTVIRFIDVLVYIKYIKSFLLASPFILIIVLALRFFSKKIKVFSDESHKILLLLFFSIFIVHFLGQFYLYHFHFDVELRISYFSVLEERGYNEYIKQVSPSQLAATGAKEGIMPYPPWYNLIALPFVKLGFDTDFWLRFQFLLLSTLLPFAIYALARRLGLGQIESRWSSFLSIFFMGFLDDLFFNAYDRVMAFLFAAIFIYFWLKTISNPQKTKMIRSVMLGSLLGVAFVMHPSVPIVLSIFMFISFLFFLFNPRVRSKQLVGRTILIYCVGLAVSMIIFYGPYIGEVLTKTLPSAMTAGTSAGNKSFSFNEAGSLLTQMFWRIIRYTPIIIIPVIVIGFSRIRKQYLKKDNYISLYSLYIWFISYVLLVFLRCGPILKNVFIWIPEQLFIYPIASVLLGIGISNILNNKNFRFHHSKLIKIAVYSSIGIWASFNLFWYYATRIGMIRAAGYLPKWLKLIA